MHLPAGTLIHGLGAFGTQGAVYDFLWRSVYTTWAGNLLRGGLSGGVLYPSGVLMDKVRKGMEGYGKVLFYFYFDVLEFTCFRFPGLDSLVFRFPVFRFPVLDFLVRCFLVFRFLPPCGGIELNVRNISAASIPPGLGGI